MLYATPVRPDQMGQATAFVDPTRAVAARICILRAAGQSDAAIMQALPKEFANLSQDGLRAAFATANQMCPTGAPVTLAPIPPPALPATTMPPPNGVAPPIVPDVCPPCPTPEKGWPWWAWALIGFGTATTFGLIIYAVARKK